MSELIREHYAPVVARAATAEHDRRRAAEMEETARRHAERYKATARELAAFTDGLSAAQQTELKQTATRWRQVAEERKRQEAEKARQQQEEAERARKLAATKERERRECALIERLKTATPLEFAGADEALRRECLRLMLDRDDLHEAYNRMMTSGFFEASGHLSQAGRQAMAEKNSIEVDNRGEPEYLTTPPAAPNGPGM